MRWIIPIILILILLSGCQGLPTLEVTATSVPTRLPTVLVPAATAVIVQIIGDVYVRDDQGKVMGWLLTGDHVQATCSGDWCRISSGSYSGYRIWRGCSADNPERRSCQAR